MNCEKEFEDDPVFDQIKSTLLKLGFASNTKGFRYISCAIYLGIFEEKSRYCVCRSVFPKLAKMFDTSTFNIENTSRHALEDAYFSGGFKNINSVLGITYLRPYERPTLTNFISTMIERSMISIK